MSDEPTSPPVSASSSSSSFAAQQQQQDELLSDVNAELHRIVSSSSGLESDDVTLSEPQVTALRKLELRIRSSLSSQQRGFRRALTGNENKRVRDHARSQVQRTSHIVKKRVRKVVTGSSDRALRDWVKEAKVVKTVDKFSFVLGVFVLCATEFMVLQYPEHFGTYYVILVSAMMALRYYMYARSRYLYFMIDFCYFANAACFVSVLAMPDSPRLWRLNFAVSNGTLLGALLAWRNSLVFHSLDKVTSIAIHLLPGLLTYVERWSNESKMCPPEDTACSLGFSGALAEPLVFYIIWQLLYILKTEVIDRERMLADPSIQTSLRWLTRDAKNPMHKMAKPICRTLGILGEDEQFDPEALKTKMVFWVGQLIFIFITLLPTAWLFANHTVHVGYILFVLSMAVYNGSNYYFEVFAARYLQQLEAASSSQKDEAAQKEDDGVKQE